METNRAERAGPLATQAFTAGWVKPFCRGSRNQATCSGPKRAHMTGVRAGLADMKKLAKGFKACLRTLSEFDILVNAQGIHRRYPAISFPLEDLDQVLEINLMSVFELSQLAARVMYAKGGGKIINIASMQSFTGGFTIPAYAASKGGVTQLTEALSNEWAGSDICVNAIAPGFMDTKMATAVRTDPVRYAQILARIPIREVGQA
jgi:2-deoxy-D-gluconate 3-dehydrogenase